MAIINNELIECHKMYWPKGVETLSVFLVFFSLLNTCLFLHLDFSFLHSFFISINHVDSWQALNWYACEVMDYALFLPCLFCVIMS